MSAGSYRGLLREFEPIEDGRRTFRYPYLRADGVAVAWPLLQGDGGGSIPTSALQLRFELIPLEVALQLNALWHSMMPDLSPFGARSGVYSVSYAAEHDGGWFAVAIWSGPPAVNRMKVDDVEEIIELRRLAVAPQAPKNTPSRMLGWMARDLRERYPSLCRLSSYQAEEVHSGTIYRAAGWKPVARAEFRPWVRSRSPQVGGAKVRWEYELRKFAA